MRLVASVYMYICVQGVQVDLEARDVIEDQWKWDGKGSPPEAGKKVWHPLPTTLITDLQTD